jgi:hypothetical protein
MLIRVTVAVVLVLLVGGCDSSSDPSGESAPPPGSTTLPDSQPTDRGVLVRRPKVEHLPHDWSMVRWEGDGRPEQTPDADAGLPSVLDEPGIPARLAYHPMESLADPEGWASEQIMFWGRDGQWRILDMADLGLPEAWWPGRDTFGPGSLSADGLTWAAHTNAGVVFVDLTTGSYRHVLFPQSSPMVRYLSWVPGRRVVSAYSRSSHGTRYSTFDVDPRGRVIRAAYDGSRTRFDVNGVPVEITTSGRTVTLTRRQRTQTSSTEWDLPVRFPRANPWGVFSDQDVAFTQPTNVNRRRAILWVFDKRSGQPQARLSVPADPSLEGWTDSGALVIQIDNRRVITWNPQTGRFSRLLEFPALRRPPSGFLAATVSLPGP